MRAGFACWAGSLVGCGEVMFFFLLAFFSFSLFTELCFLFKFLFVLQVLSLGQLPKIHLAHLWCSLLYYKNFMCVLEHMRICIRLGFE
jgi:hypothetical protein